MATEMLGIWCDIDASRRRGYNLKNHSELSASIKEPHAPEWVDTLRKTSYPKVVSEEDPRHGTFDTMSKNMDGGIRAAVTQRIPSFQYLHFKFKSLNTRNWPENVLACASISRNHSDHQAVKDPAETWWCSEIFWSVLPFPGFITTLMSQSSLRPNTPH